MERSPYYEKIAVKKGSWTPEEDRKLTAYVTKYGCWNWCQIPKYAGLARCGKSCRLRWMNYLRPNIKRGNYRIEEDEMIIKLHKLLGNKWSAIAANLPGRTDNDIKNHWHTSLNKRSKEISIPDEPLPGRNRKRSTSEKDQNLSSNLESDDISKSSSLKKRPKEISIPDEPLPGRLKKDQNSSSNLENVDILKSSKNPPQPASNQFSTSTIETDATNCAINVAAECAEITAEDGGDFWTQPFLLEGSTNDIHAPLVESELQYAYFSTNGGGFVYSTGVDLFTW